MAEGILQERPHEIMALVVSVVAVWLYIILNYALGTQTAVKMVIIFFNSVIHPDN